MWRPRLHAALPGRPLPLVWTVDGLVAAASLWAGAREWTRWLRAHGLAAGDRVVCALPPGPGFVMLLVAALWEGITLAPVEPGADPDAALAAADARLAVLDGPPGASAGRVRPGPAGAPPDVPPTLRPARRAPTPDVRFLLQTSGTTGARRWIALSDANVLAVLDSHAAPLARQGAVVLSVLPWHHAFGLAIQLLPALLGGAELLRDPSGGRDPAAMLAIAREHPVTHLDAVPRTLRVLAGAPGGLALLAALAGGVVGGAPADAELAGLLAGTRLRVGYGQTEAAPGIALGDPGAWRAATLGRPLGCDVRLDDAGGLHFRGPNACLGAWDAARDGDPLARLAPDGWRDTGDLARWEDDGTLTWLGRRADAFKLANGRFVAAAEVERAARAAFPTLTEAVLSSPDGHALLLAVSVADDAPLPPPDVLAAALAPALGGLAARPLRTVAVPADRWVRTPKGELDRRWPTGRAP